jgi:hypothetical protein
MTSVTISLRLDKSLREKMKTHNEINWSAVIRRAIAEYLKNLHKMNEEKAREAFHSIEKTRKSKIFSKGKTGTEIIREWREKRK